MTGKNSTTNSTNNNSINHHTNGKSPTRTHSPAPAPPTRKPRQIRTELDRLLMDEGTVNMLCDTTPSSMSIRGLNGGHHSLSPSSHSHYHHHPPPTKKAKLEALRLRRLAVLSSVRNRSGDSGKNLREKKKPEPRISRRRSDESGSTGASTNDTKSGVGGGGGRNGNGGPASWFKGRRASLLATLKEEHLVSGIGIIGTGDDVQKKNFIPDVPGVGPIPTIQQKRILTTITPDGLGHVTISYLPNGKWTIDLKALKDLTSTLTTLDNEPKVKLILISSSGAKFCNGLDVREFIGPGDRKKFAEEMANAVWNYLRTLASLRKLIIISLHSSVSNLFVTSLPLYDLVYASDKSTFRCNYLTLNQVPEAGRILFETIGKVAFNNLIYGRRVFTASEAKDCGLVNEVLWPARFHQEVILRVRNLLNWKTNALNLTKSSLPKLHSISDEKEMSIEKTNLINSWTSDNFYGAVKGFLSERELKI